MPSPFARSLPGASSWKNWIPPVIIFLVVAVLMILYVNTSSVTPRKMIVETREEPQRRISTVVTSTGFVSVSNANDFENNKLHYTTGGSKASPVFLMLHSNQPNASSRDWGHLYEALSDYGTYYGIDTINHGKSEPGPLTKKRVILLPERVAMLGEFIDTKFPERNDIILLAKDTAASEALLLARKYQSQIKGLVLIAPEFKSELVIENQYLPILLVWAKEDIVAPFENASLWEEAFHDITPVYFDHITAPGVSKVESHNPEKIVMEEVMMELADWLRQLKYRKPLHDEK